MPPLIQVPGIILDHPQQQRPPCKGDVSAMRTRNAAGNPKFHRLYNDPANGAQVTGEVRRDVDLLTLE